MSQREQKNNNLILIIPLSIVIKFTVILDFDNSNLVIQKNYVTSRIS